MYIYSQDLQNKRKAFANKKSLAAESLASTAADHDGVFKGDRRGSFFQSVEQQLALNRRYSMSPQNKYIQCIHLS